jgi:hypothetical protein
MSGEADIKVTLRFDPKDGRYRVLVEQPGAVWASEARTIRQALTAATEHLEQQA